MQRETAIDVWETLLWLGVCVLFAVFICAIAAALVGRWPLVHMAPPVSGVVTAPVAAAAAARPAPSVASVQAGMLDVLGELPRPHLTPYIPRTPAQSNTLAEALQRAVTYPVFDAVLARHDPEGLIEAAAWAVACQHEVMLEATRCDDARLREAGYADTLLESAAAAGQPGAIIELALRYPLMWSTIPLDGNVTLDDAVLMLGSHGDVTALDLLLQQCMVPDACRDASFTRDVLTVMIMHLARSPGEHPPGETQRGHADYWQRVTLRATQVLKMLKLQPARRRRGLCRDRVSRRARCRMSDT